MNGWQTVQLGKVLKQDTNYVAELEPITYQKLSVKLYGKGVVLDAPADGANVKMQRHQFAKPGQIIVSEIWAKKGAIGIVPKEGNGALVTSHFFLFDVIETQVVREWIGLLLRRNYFAEILDAQARGTTGYAAVRPKQFLALEIPLPPLTEQRRIVEHIESLARRVNEAQRLREEAEIEAGLLFPSLISQAIKPNGDNLRTLDDLCELVTDGEHATPPRDSVGDVPLATAKNVRDGYLDLTNTDFVSTEVAEKCWKRCKPLENDILMVCVGATTGRVCRLIDPPDIVIVRSVALFRPIPTIIDSRYLEYALESSACQSQIWDLVKRAAQPGIYISSTKRILIPAPPLDEQRRIVAYLDGLQGKVNALRELQSKSGEELAALMPSVLDKAFKGEL